MRSVYYVTYMEEPRECWSVRPVGVHVENGTMFDSVGPDASRNEVRAAARKAEPRIQPRDRVIVDGPEWGCGSDLDELEEG